MKNNFKIVFMIVILIVVFLSIGYSAFTANLNIDNMIADVRIKRDIRVTGISVDSATDGVESYYEDYNVTSINSSISLPNIDSSITYKVEITNIEATEMGLYDITGLPDNLKLYVDEDYYNLKDKLCDNNDSTKCNLGSVKDIYITISYDTDMYDENNTDFIINLNFDFREFHTITYTNINSALFPYEVIDGDVLKIDFGNSTLDYISSSGTNLVENTDYAINGSVLTIYEVSSNLNIVFERVNTGSSILLSDYINDLYDSDTSINEITNGTINYAYTDSNIGLMKDRFGNANNIINSGNLRYYGSDPNNYIYFNCDTYPSTNCERWRIIGVFDGKIKIIRSSSIGSYSFDNKTNKLGSSKSNNGSNVWSDARLMMLLNSGFEDGYSDSTGTIYGFPGSLYWNGGTGSCYAESTTGGNVVDCDFSINGLKNLDTRSLISESTWYVTAGNSYNINIGPLYEKERGLNTWTGEIAVPYPSDYGFAADFNECNQTIYNYDNPNCSSNNWMFNILTDSGTNSGWLLTPYSSATYSVWFVNNAGRTYYNNFYVRRSGVVAPVLYLEENVYFYDGIGSYDNPIQITF